MISLKFQGASQFGKALANLSPSESRGVLNKMLVEAAEPIRQAMEDKTPVEPGKPDLRDHIGAKPVSAKTIEDAEVLGKRIREDSEAVVAIGPEAPFFYAWFLEFGTVHSSAQPFVRPAFDAKVNESFQVLQGLMWAYLRNQSMRSTTGRGL